MKKLILIAVALLSVSLAQAKQIDNFKLIHVSDLTQMMTTDTTHVAIFDANTDDTRKVNGIIPGAKLLTSSKSYDIAKTLPTDKTTQLVFYCVNTACMASHAAAARAATAGYKNVSVMADGIQGWKKSGQKTTTLN